MEKIKLAFLGLILLFIIPTTGGAAGFFGGSDTDDEGQRFSYIGMVTDGKVFFNLLAGDLLYYFEDNEKLREAKIRSITPAIGFRKEGPLTLTLAVGPTFREIKEEQDSGFKTETEAGGFIQLGGFLWGQNGNLEALVSYTTLDNFFWGRLRGKEKIIASLYAGTEFFLMGNKDFDAWGVGPLLELRGERVTLGIKAGYKHTSTFKGGVYAGIELFTSF